MGTVCVRRDSSGGGASIAPIVEMIVVVGGCVSGMISANADPGFAGSIVRGESKEEERGRRRIVRRKEEAGRGKEGKEGGKEKSRLDLRRCLLTSRTKWNRTRRPWLRGAMPK